MRKKNYFIISLLVISIVILCACNNKDIKVSTLVNASEQNLYDNTNFSRKIKDTSNRDIMPGTEKLKGIRYRIYNTDGNIDQESNYTLKHGQAWDKFISIGNMIDNDSTYELLLFVDFKQTSFEVDNKNVDKFTFQVKANQTLEIPVTINNLEDGLHDVMFVIVNDPLNKSLDPRYRSTTIINNMLYLRFFVTVENDMLRQYSMSSVDQNKIKNDFPNVVVNKDKINVNNWLIETTNPGGLLNYYTHIANNDLNNKRKYAIITLLDSKQVEVNKNIVSYIEIDEGKEISMPCVLKLPDIEGVHNLTTIVIPNPFEKNEKNMLIYSSARIGLNLEKNY